MTKARKGIMWSLIAILAALLVALAVVGVTFARYSSEGEGSGSASVAKWDVAVVDAGEGTGVVMADSFSPSAAAYEMQAREHESGKILVATITNSGNVAAEVTVSGGTTLTYTFDESACTGSCGCITDGAYVSASCTDCTTEPGNEGYCDFCYGYETLGYGADLDNHFSLKLYQNSTEESAGASALGDSATLAASGGTMYIFAEITWITDTDAFYGDSGDAFDTWCGHYLASISFDLTYEAVQASDK